MNFNNYIKIAGYWFLLISIVFFCVGCVTQKNIPDAKPAGRLPGIQPDYSGIVIPPNIAPLNFSIKETGEDFVVRIHSKNGEPIQIENNSGLIQIPMKQWKRLVSENPGEELIVDIYLKNQAGQWISFNPIVNKIAQESMDGYLSFRRFKPLFNLWKKMGIFQRCLENFDEKPILLNRLTQDNCMNCHTFWQNETDKWLLHLRGGPGTAMLLVTDGKARRVNTKTKFSGVAAYSAWHPSGELVAFSVSKLLLFHHEMGEDRDVLDRSSDIYVYDINTNTITTTPQISDPHRMEIWPAWSPDGTYLYFCSAPELESYADSSRSGEVALNKIKYDLMRIAYDPLKHSWGNLETVISSSDIGLSITEPRVSPDGRFVLFTAASNSQFPIYIQSADLYVLEVKTNRWKKLELNSDKADSFHSWSSNGRWIVFSSKREDGLFTKPYFSYFDTSGHAAKPFVLPQENPLSYETSLEIYNAPEFTKEPVHISPQDLAKAAFSEQDALNAKFDSTSVAEKNTNKTNSAKQVRVPSK
ncbi:MAG TPA: hypothetical protein VMU30_00370 [Bacteroidota bacterium]|nr:hypothetical protein [Bacteroidota bacterium]